MINVTKTFLPPIEDYNRELKKVWERAWLTNNGPAVIELQDQLKTYLGVNNLLFCNNGTIAIQLAIRALKLSGEIITTPFSYVATTNSIIWENCKPVFADVRADDFNIDAGKIESLITPRTSAILAVHVYGNPCDTDTIAAIARKHNLKVIYDGAHAFGASHLGQSLLSFGDITTCSFHATKLFHTVEGGAVICNDETVASSVKLLHQFGHIADDYYCVGINGKSSEVHAVMGLCNLPYVAEIIKARKQISELYDSKLDGKLQRPYSVLGGGYNYSYYPVLFESEMVMQNVRAALLRNGISTRRYFYPSLNRLPFLEHSESCPVSEDAAARVLSLPLYYDLSLQDVERIANIVIDCVG